MLEVGFILNLLELLFLINAFENVHRKFQITMLVTKSSQNVPRTSFV